MPKMPCPLSCLLSNNFAVVLIERRMFTKTHARLPVGERVPTSVGRRDDPDGDLVEVNRGYW